MLVSTSAVRYQGERVSGTRGLGDRQSGIGNRGGVREVWLAARGLQLGACSAVPGSAVGAGLTARVAAAVVMFAVLTGAGGAAWGQTVKYVDATATGLNNGSSWTDAFTSLVTALENDVAGWQIRVAQGIYAPSGSTQAATFLIDTDSLEIYGGYAGLQGENPDARDIAEYETILTGVVATTPSIVRAYHVVTFTTDIDDLDGNGMPTTILDGVTVTMGNANVQDHEELDASGGGILISFGEPLIRNCTIENNDAYAYGAGAYMRGDSSGDGDDARFENCKFISNEVVCNGGGLLIETARIKVINCTFDSNVSTGTTSTYGQENGGGGAWIAPGYNDANKAEATFRSCTFRYNSDKIAGGGLGVSTADHQPPVLLNCVFHNNSADDGSSLGKGGGVWSRRELLLTNVTFAKTPAARMTRAAGFTSTRRTTTPTPSSPIASSAATRRPRNIRTRPTRSRSSGAATRT